MRTTDKLYNAKVKRAGSGHELGDVGEGLRLAAAGMDKPTTLSFLLPSEEIGLSTITLKHKAITAFPGPVICLRFTAQRSSTLSKRSGGRCSQ